MPAIQLTPYRAPSVPCLRCHARYMNCGSRPVDPIIPSPKRRLRGPLLAGRDPACHPPSAADGSADRATQVLLIWRVTERTGDHGWSRTSSDLVRAATSAVLLGIDAILDMARTSVNVVGNCLATAVVARWEGVELT
jgi:hypothetical protein